MGFRLPTPPTHIPYTPVSQKPHVHSSNLLLKFLRYGFWPLSLSQVHSCRYTTNTSWLALTTNSVYHCSCTAIALYNDGPANLINNAQMGTKRQRDSVHTQEGVLRAAQDQATLLPHFLLKRPSKASRLRSRAVACACVRLLIHGMYYILYKRADTQL